MGPASVFILPQRSGKVNPSVDKPGSFCYNKTKARPDTVGGSISGVPLRMPPKGGAAYGLYSTHTYDTDPLSHKGNNPSKQKKMTAL